MIAKDHKYVLLRVAERGKEDNPSYAIFTYAHPSHCYIASEAIARLKQFGQENGLELVINILGGGRVNVDNTRRQIRAYDRSIVYGRANPRIVANLLQEANPDFKVDVA